VAQRVVVIAGSAAAAIAVIVGLGTMSSSDNDSKDSAAMAPTESVDSANRPSGGPVMLGDVSSSEELRRSVQYQLRAPTTPRAAGSETSATAQSSDGPNAPEFAFDDARAKRSAAACLPATQAEAGGMKPALTGRGTSAGRPVTVYVFRSGNAYDVVVVGRDCSVVDRLSLP
jgi:hypothetical protein